jgi:hypothetical protein
MLDVYLTCTSRSFNWYINVLAANGNSCLKSHYHSLTHSRFLYQFNVSQLPQPFPKVLGLLAWTGQWLIAKIHKTSWKTRPIVSVGGSLYQGLGLWVDTQLSPALPYVYCSLTHVCNCHCVHAALPLSPWCFSLDTVLMYTNIDTIHALLEICAYFELRYIWAWHDVCLMALPLSWT